MAARRIAESVRSFLSGNWRAIGTTAIALFGGVPGACEIYRQAFHSPELVVTEAISFASFASDHGVRKRVRLLAITLSNGGRDALTPAKCELVHHFEGTTRKFQPMVLHTDEMPRDLPGMRLTFSDRQECDLNSRRFTLEYALPVEGLMLFVDSDPNPESEERYNDPDLELSCLDPLGERYSTHFSPKAPPPPPLSGAETLLAGDCLRVGPSPPAAEASRSMVERLAGAWKNVDGHTRSITRISIDIRGHDAIVEAWASCVPVECKWGESRGTVDGDSLRAVWQWKFGQKDVRLTTLDGQRLETETTTVFNDGRPSSKSVNRFRRE